jgi:inosine/xanthosine triphosphate pyrophosphatase family protein/adenylate kinase family enzyme
MLDITFITSNITKLAHAKHLSKEYNVNILHYKKKYYGIGYIEPRIPDKKRLLEESMNDAIKRWKKHVSENKTQLFFIEDTSVKIDALSDCDNEVPGTDIKYWMIEQNFLKLDDDLKRLGNNRRASVTSHIVLFLTKDIQKRGNYEYEYIAFKSTTFGKIVDKEYLIDTNILYPWLDNKTFNKWFVPDGYDKPLSMLDISDADMVDFRKGAFEDMIIFIKKHCDLINKRNINNISFLPFIPLYIICGPTCAGKSSIGKYLLERHGYYHIEASDFMSLKYFEIHGANFTIDKNIFAAEALKVNPLIVVENILKYIQTKKLYDNKFIVTGFRTPDEVSGFCKQFISQDMRIIFMISDFDVRFNRWLKRHRDNIDYTIERFTKINNLQEEMGLLNIKKIENISIYENDKDGLEYLFNDFKEKYIDINFVSEIKTENFMAIQTVSLEKVILVTLAIEYRKNESSYYTTTEISRLINENFNGKYHKNKNNVSRYFNQSYYPYYEIKREKQKNKYKLSPTGYSEACTIVVKYKDILNDL